MIYSSEEDEERSPGDSDEWIPGILFLFVDWAVMDRVEPLFPLNYFPTQKRLGCVVRFCTNGFLH